MFFMGSLYLQLVQGYDALQIGLAFLPITIIMGTLTGRYSRAADHALRRPAAALPGPRPGRRRAGPVHAGAGRRATTSSDVLPVLILLGTGIGVCFPALMTLAMSGATRGRRRTRLRPGQHLSAGRRRARPGGACDAVHVAQQHLEDAGHSTASALTSGYHLAFWIAAGLVVAAIAVAATVIQPEEKAAEQFAGDEAPGEMPQAEETAYSEAA